MSRKVDKFIEKEFNKIFEESKEYRAFQLGMARGWFYLYDHTSKELGEKEADRIFDVHNSSKDNEVWRKYFLQMVDIDKEQDNESEFVSKMLDVVKDYKSKLNGI